MAVNVEAKICKLSPVRRKRGESRATELIAVETRLRQLRNARRITPVKMGKARGSQLDSVSGLDMGSDLLFSALRRACQGQ